jgi:hypothetical protein
MLYLEDNLLIRRGTKRVCHHHPENSRLIVKTSFEGHPEGEKANIMELYGYQDLIRTHVDLQNISHCFGFVTTDRGPGLVSQAIRDENGTDAISKSIWDIILYQDSCDVDYISSVMKGFCDYLKANDIFLFDLNLKNILLQIQDDHSYVPYAVDLKGRFDLKEPIPLSKYSKYFARKKLLRRSIQLLDRIHEFHNRKEELKSIDGRTDSGV